MFAVRGERGVGYTVDVVGISRLHVIVQIDPHLLSSAIAQFLARDPSLSVQESPPNGDNADHVDEMSGGYDAHAVRIELIEHPFRFELHHDGQAWTVDYQGLDELAGVLSDLAHRQTSCN